jgi:hypothetical protein
MAKLRLVTAKHFILITRVPDIRQIRQAHVSMSRDFMAVWVPDMAYEAMNGLARKRATAMARHGQGAAASAGFPAAARPDLSGQKGLDEGLLPLANDGSL